MAKSKKKIVTTKTLNDPTERKKFKTTLATITQYFQQIDDHKEAIKEVIQELENDTGLSKKTLRKLAITMYRHNYASLQEENQHFQTLYETIIEGRLTDVSDPLDKKAA